MVTFYMKSFNIVESGDPQDSVMHNLGGKCLEVILLLWSKSQPNIMKITTFVIKFLVHLCVRPEIDW